MSRILSPKKLFELVRLMSGQGCTPETIERWLETLMTPGRETVQYNTTQRQIWRQVFSLVERDRRRALELIDKVREYTGIEELDEYRDLISTSRQRRQRKIKSALSEGHCVVFLGPELLRVRINGNYVPFNTYLCRELQAEMETRQFYFDLNLKDNVAYMAQCYSEGMNRVPGVAGAFARERYLEIADNFETEIFEELAKLPVHLVINANPDRFFLEALRGARENEPGFAYHDTSNVSIEEGTEEEKDAPRISAISAEEPFIYNIFGIFDDEDSILFTESEFMQFIGDVISGLNPLDNDVTTELMKKDTYLFLGFDFDQWYFKILFQLFELKRTEEAALSIGYDQSASHPISIFNQEFYEQEFKIFFIADDIKNMVRDLNNIV